MEADSLIAPVEESAIPSKILKADILTTAHFLPFRTSNMPIIIRLSSYWICPRFLINGITKLDDLDEIEFVIFILFEKIFSSCGVKKAAGVLDWKVRVLLIIHACNLDGFIVVVLNRPGIAGGSNS